MGTTMSANQCPSSSEQEDYEPKEGSWVSELEDAQADLDELLQSGDPALVKRRRGTALQVYERLCRAYETLRLWTKLEEASTKGLEVCSSYGTEPDDDDGGGAAEDSDSALWDWEVRFVSCRSLARRELSVRSSLDAPMWSNLHTRLMAGTVDPNGVYRPHSVFRNSNLLQYSALTGDVRLLEAMVASGAAIDYPFLEGDGANKVNFPIVAPTDATALVMVCAHLAKEKLGRTHPFVSPQEQEVLDKLAECATQLVHLGANPAKRLHWSKAADTDTSRDYRDFRFNGKSALELATLAGQRDLVELMEQHLRCSPEERARMVHCRCGSRLPWEECHGSTGLGMPVHYVVDDASSPGGGVVAVVHYRVSPIARCPCHNTELMHYECCWKDTSCPAYLNDSTGQHVRELPLEWWTLPRIDQKRRLGTVHWLHAGIREDKMAFLRTSPDQVRALYGDDGPQSHMASWDPKVYLGCLERLDKAFVWRDLHWRLDKSELLRRTREWNEALEAYCDDTGLVGNERDRVIEQHTANPCAPCGRVGCPAFEPEPKEFPRCSRCKLIAYCGQTCQRMDWHHHRRPCGSYNDLPSEQLEYLLSTFTREDAVAAVASRGRVRSANP